MSSFAVYISEEEVNALLKQPLASRWTRGQTTLGDLAATLRISPSRSTSEDKLVSNAVSS
jgi:hypothetical protein